MSFVFHILHTVPYSNKPIVKDVIASLHSYFTCNLLIAFSVIISFKQFGGRPMECMLPLGFSGAWEQYAENFCWAQDTYFIPPKVFVEDISAEERRERRISYYQWMPFFLLFQAACFKAPTLIWKYFAGQSGMKLGQILRLAGDPANSSLEVKKGNIEALCMHLQGALRFHERVKKKKLVPHKICRFLNIKYANYYVATVYILAKLAFLANAVFQISLMTRYLLPELENNYGLESWMNIIWPKNVSPSWHHSGIFPLVTLCDFEVREMGNVQTHTVQCVLVLNLFTEKIFILLWVWFMILATLTSLSVLNWIYLLTENCSKEHFILNHLEMSGTPFDKNDPQNKKHVDRFLHEYLGIDGIFVLRMVANHADVVFATELVASLWRSHYVFEEKRKNLLQMDKVWPQHQQRLELALLEEAETARKISSDALNALQRKRSVFFDSPYFVKRSSLTGITIPKVPSRSMLGSSCAPSRNNSRDSIIPFSPRLGNHPRGSIFSTDSQGKPRRRHSLEEIDTGCRVKKFADSSDEEEREKEKRPKSLTSRKSTIKIW
ncbi:innexin family protein [Wuchereria bancrofti]|uniref:Innexin n=1 Tax=Wuchereria bancrofti TaxID=6293 RepID=J9EMK4_WUCBA|nr:innexin family protein [Wuchereria bancrofti]